MKLYFYIKLDASFLGITIYKVIKYEIVFSLYRGKYNVKSYSSKSFNLNASIFCTI